MQLLHFLQLTVDGSNMFGRLIFQCVHSEIAGIAGIVGMAEID